MIETIGSPKLSSVSGLRHGFFTRKGGVSTGIYASLQCGRGAKDDRLENVEENRRRAAEALGAKALLSAHQYHSAEVAIVTEPWAADAAPKADAMVTDRPGIALGILTADCVPVLFVDAEAGVIGAAHAGWQGALGGVIEATLEAMEALGAQRGRVLAVTGPAIQKASYQVDSAYRDRFVADDPVNARFFGPDPEEGRYRFDLPGYCKGRIRAAGAGRIEILPNCTYAEPTRFFSNRRALHLGEGDYGRGLSAIMLRA